MAFTYCALSCFACLFFLRPHSEDMHLLALIMPHTSSPTALSQHYTKSSYDHIITLLHDILLSKSLRHDPRNIPEVTKYTTISIITDITFRIAEEANVIMADPAYI